MRVSKRMVFSAIGRVGMASFLTVLIAGNAAAQINKQCRLTDKLIELDTIELVYELNEDAVAKGAKIDAADVFFDDGVEGSGKAGGCGQGSIVGYLNCKVIEPMKNVGETPSGTSTASRTNIGSGADEDIASPGAQELAGSKARITIPVKRYLLQGNPSKIYSYPVGRPNLTTQGPVDKAGTDRLQAALNKSLKALIQTPYTLSRSDFEQLLNDKTDYSPTIPTSGDDNIITTSSATKGPRLPWECLSLVKTNDKISQLQDRLREARRECKKTETELKSLVKSHENDSVFEKMGSFFDKHNPFDESQSTIGRQRKLLALCKNEIKNVNRLVRDEKKIAHRRRMAILEDQKRRDVAQIKADPQSLAQEEKVRTAKAIEVLGEQELQFAKIKKGIKAYDKNLKAMDTAIKTLEKSNDPKKEEKIAALKRDRERYQATKDSWLKNMRATQKSRKNDFARLMKENRTDGIGPTNYDEVSDRFSADKTNPNRKVELTEYIKNRLGDKTQFADRQAARDRKSLGGSTTTGLTGLEYAKEIAKDYYTMSPAERLRRLAKYGPSYVQGVGEGTAEGLHGLYKLGKGAIDVAAESVGLEGFKGNSLDKIVSGYDKGKGLFDRGADGRKNNKSAYENYADNSSRLLDAGSSKVDRAIEKSAGSGEKGIKNMTRLTGKGTAMVAGAEVLAAQAAAKLVTGAGVVSKLGKAVDAGSDAGRALDAGSDAARAADTAGDVTKTLEAGGDATRTFDGAEKASRTADSVNDATRTFDGANSASSTGGSINDATRGLSPSQAADAAAEASAIARRQAKRGDLGDLGPLKRQKAGSKARRTSDALEAAGVEPQFARFYGSKATEHSVEHAIAAGAFEKGLSPKTLLKSGSISEEGLRRGMKSMLKERGIVDAGEQAQIIKKFMSRPTPKIAPSVPKTPAKPVKSAALQPPRAASAPAKAIQPSPRPARPPSKAMSGRLSEKASSSPLPKKSAIPPSSASKIPNSSRTKPPAIKTPQVPGVRKPGSRTARRYSRKELYKRLGEPVPAKTPGRIPPAKTTVPPKSAGRIPRTEKILPSKTSSSIPRTERMGPPKTAARISPTKGFPVPPKAASPIPPTKGFPVAKAASRIPPTKGFPRAKAASRIPPTKGFPARKAANRIPRTEKMVPPKAANRIPPTKGFPAAKAANRIPPTKNLPTTKKLPFAKATQKLQMDIPPRPKIVAKPRAAKKVDRKPTAPRVFAKPRKPKKLAAKDPERPRVRAKARPAPPASVRPSIMPDGKGRGMGALDKGPARGMPKGKAGGMGEMAKVDPRGMPDGKAGGLLDADILKGAAGKVVTDPRPFGMLPKVMRSIQEKVNEFGLNLRIRAANSTAISKLRAGHPPKHVKLKSKTINDLDVELGAPSGSQGEVGFFRPKKPKELSLPKEPPNATRHQLDRHRERVAALNEHHAALQKRFKQRLKEFDDNIADIKKLTDQGLISVENGVVIDRGLSNTRLGADGILRRNPNGPEGGTGKGFTGDHDMWDFRHPDGSKIVTDPKSPKFNADAAARKAKLQAELDKGLAQTQHGPHKDWKPATERDIGIDQNIRKKHSPGGNDALLEFRPHERPRTSYEIDESGKLVSGTDPR